MPAAPPPTPLLARRWLRIAVGLALFGLCAVLALAAYFLPYVTIQARAQTVAVGGAEQTANLHLVLVATGVIGAGVALAYALSRQPLRLAFFAVGGIALALAAFLTLDAYQTVSNGWIRDPGVYRALGQGADRLHLGSALYTSLAAAVGILGLAVVVLLVARATTPPPPAPRRTRF